MTAVENTARHASALLDLLVDVGPLPAADIRAKLGWSPGRFSNALRFARQHLCADLGIAVPAPVPTDGWLYRVTTDWEPVEAGASYGLGQVESRLLSIHRDVRIILPHLGRGTKEWRRANFLAKHLAHILGTLSEIDNG